LYNINRKIKKVSHEINIWNGRRKRMLTMLKSLLKDERGQGMAEYGLILALVAVVAMAALALLGPAIRDKFTAVTTKLNE
jgi:pilus assembly protein Flp/PilA